MSETSAGFMRVGEDVVYTCGWTPTPGHRPANADKRLVNLYNPSCAMSADRMRQTLQRLREVAPAWEHFVCSSQRSLVRGIGDTHIVWLPHHVWLSESSWQPSPEVSPRWRALLSASPLSWKRHALAAQCEGLAVAGYYHRMNLPAEEQLWRSLPQMLPLATIVTDLSGGKPPLNAAQMRQLYCESRCSLVLSSSEGQSRTVGESLLCGVPVITTPHTGGRMEIVPPQCYLQVPATPAAVAAAVRHFETTTIRPQSIRDDYLETLQLARDDVDRRFGRMRWGDMPAAVPWLPLSRWS